MTIQEELQMKYQSLDLECLSEKIRKSGFDYQLVKRTPSKCLYCKKSGGAIIAYELFKTKIVPHRENMQRLAIKQNKAFNASQYSEYKESFPNDEEFGKREWSLPNDLETALKRFENL